MPDKKCLLVVDDDRSNLKRAEFLLKAEYHQISVISGEQALRFLEKKIPDLILLDIDMPVMDGYAVMKKIKADARWRKIPVFFLTASSDKSTQLKCFQMGAVDFIVKPFEADIMLTRIKRTLELEEYRKSLEAYRHKLEFEVKMQTEKIINIQQEVIISMANLIESRDGSTGGHVKRTTGYVRMIAEKLVSRGLFAEQLTPDFIFNLGKAAPMHDIGKITVADSILKKNGALIAEEYEIMKNHTLEGGKIIRQNLSNIEEADFVDIAYEVAVYHHEKWNGTGYPFGLAGEDIPLSARIMAVADVFDALRSKRCYKKELSLSEVLALMQQNDKQFDPLILEAFLGLEKDLL